MVAVLAALFAVVPAIRSRVARAAGQSSTYTLVLSNSATGSGSWDLPANCPPASQVQNDVIPPAANSTGQAHCAGMDFSASDSIVRALDTVTVKIDWQLVTATGAFQISGQPADSNVTVTVTIPNAPNGQPLGQWTGLPGACYVSTSGISPTITPLSSYTGNSNRTLVCNIGHKIQGSTGFFLATYRTTGYATDGTRIDLQGSIQGDTTRVAANPQTQSNVLSVWSSANAKYNLRLDQSGWTLNGGDVLGPANEDGRLVTFYAQVYQPLGTESIGVSTCCANNSPHFSFDIDMSRMGNIASADDGGASQIWQRARLWTWAGGANAYGTNSTNYRASQPGGAGGNIHIDAWTLNTGTVAPNTFNAWIYIYVWYPNAALPTPGSTSLVAAATGFDPTTMAGPNFASGQNNYGGAGEACLQVAAGQQNPANCEPGLVRANPYNNHSTVPNDNEYYMTGMTRWLPPAVKQSREQSYYLNDGDIRNGAYNGYTYATDGSYGTLPIYTPGGGGYSDPNAPALPGAQVLAATGLQNNGNFANTGEKVCEKWDNRTQKLTDFGDATKPIFGGNKNFNTNFSPNTWAVVLTSGAPALDPGLKWKNVGPYANGSPHNYEMKPSKYTLEFGVGEYVPSAAFTNMRQTTCRNQDSPAGWFTDPNDPQIQQWIDLNYGPGSGITPLDVVNKVRLTPQNDLQPGQGIDLVVRLTVRTTWGPTTTGGVAGTTIAPGTKIVFDGAETDDYIASFANSGTTRINGWWVGNYDPSGAAEAGTPYGDRLTIHKVDVQAATHTLWPAGQGADSITSVIAGQDVWLRVDPYLYAATNVPPGTPAYNLRAIVWLPPSLSYVPGSGCRVSTGNLIATTCAALGGTPLEPVLVTLAGNNGSLAIFDLGAYVPDNGSIRTPIVLRTTSDVLTNNGVAARIATVIESMNSDGTANSLLPVCSSLASIRTVPVPATTNGPAENVGIATNCANYRESAVQLTIFNPSGLVFSGRVAQQQIEVNDSDDGTGNLVGYTVTTKNFDTNAIGWTDQIIELPYNGDGRRPSSAFHGAITLRGVATSDALSAGSNPNQLPVSWTNPPSRAGTTFYYTSRASALVTEDPADASNLVGGATQWCLQTQFGNAGCPANLAAVTAVRVISGALAGNGALRTVTLSLNTANNQRFDVYAFHSLARAGSYALMLRSVDSSMSVVDSSLGGTLWVDANGNGLIDGSEPLRLQGVRVNLLDNLNNVLATKTTSALGFFNFTGLHSGSYKVQVVNTNGTDGAADLYPALANDYDTDSGSVNSGGNPDMLAAFTVAKNVQRTDAVFGFSTTTLSGFAWLDNNRDGLVDPGETPRPGQTITLTGTDDLGGAVNRSTLTALDGTYSFPLLRPGVYSVAVTAQPGSVTAYAGSAGGTPNGLEVDNITLKGGMTAINYMFATIAPTAGITLWIDANHNGKLDAGERGIKGVRAHIRSHNNQLQLNTADDTTTDDTGAGSLYS